MSISLVFCLFLIWFVVYETTHDGTWPGGRA